jgi:hypothetical protein
MGLGLCLSQLSKESWSITGSLLPALDFWILPVALLLFDFVTLDKSCPFFRLQFPIWTEQFSLKFANRLKQQVHKALVFSIMLWVAFFWGHPQKSFGSHRSGPLTGQLGSKDLMDLVLWYTLHSCMPHGPPEVPAFPGGGAPPNHSLPCFPVDPQSPHLQRD